MPEESLVIAAPGAMMPALELKQAAFRYEQMKAFCQAQLKVDVDYGSAGAGKLPSLKKPGAEKLATFFGLTAHFTITEQIMDWTGADHGGIPLFAFTQECKLYRGDQYIAAGTGHCNSLESRYAWRWVNRDAVPQGVDPSTLLKRDSVAEEYDFAVQKRDTNPPYGKPEAYWNEFDAAIKDKRAERIVKTTQTGKNFPGWRIATSQFRIRNPDVFDIVNTVLKISNKRAFVAAVVIGTNASDYFSQDLDDDDPPHTHTHAAPAAPEPPPFHPQPPAPQASPVPDELAQIFQRMVKGSREERIAEFQAMERALRETRGNDDGEACYRKILQSHQVENASDFKSLSAARACIADLWEAVGDGAPVVEEPEH